MGKSDFPNLYRNIKSRHGNITCKICVYSSQYDENKDYVGIIVYGIRGNTKWSNKDGRKGGYNGRSFFIILMDTSNFPSDRPRNQGIVHHYPLEDLLGYKIITDEVLCGGFAYHNKTLKFNSVYLNSKDQTGIDGQYGGSDHTKEMSQSEKELARFCWEMYQILGPEAVFTIPDEIEKRILGVQDDATCESI